MTIAAIIAARMGSTRFPGKVMAELCGKPVLQHVIERCQASDVDQVIVATIAGDKEILALCQQMGIGVSIAPKRAESDVLGRVVAAATDAGVDAVVRVNGDSPFIDSEDINALVTEYMADSAKNDYYHYSFANVPSVLTHQAMPELVTTACLTSLQSLLRHTHEHVTWACHTPIRVSSVSFNRDHLPSHNTIDTPEDLERLVAQCKCGSATS